jgi:hypothetical protein
VVVPPPLFAVIVTPANAVPTDVLTYPEMVGLTYAVKFCADFEAVTAVYDFEEGAKL